jgi:hypothetical protein
MLTRKQSRVLTAAELARAQRNLAAEAKRREASRNTVREKAIALCKRFGLLPKELAKLITGRGPDKAPRAKKARVWHRTRKGKKETAILTTKRKVNGTGEEARVH